MKSARLKVLHPVAGRSMLGHVLTAVKDSGISKVCVVAGPEHEAVHDEAGKYYPGAEIFVQRERLGTAHAVLAAREGLKEGDDAIILYGDTPLLRPESIKSLRAALASGAAVSVLGFQAKTPKGYGRLVMEKERLLRIVEESEASPQEQAISFVNGGPMALSGKHALDLLGAIKADNAKGEFYLTDAVRIAHARGLETRAELVEESDVLGVNDREQLAAAEALMQQRLRSAAMRNGATLVAPETVFLSADTVLGEDVRVEPGCWFGPGVRVERGAVIHGFSHLEGARVGPGASIGPYARLRPGTVIGPNAKIGNFVEVKASDVEEGAKVNHLSYIGDARVGAQANVGAGTITCNYDGFLKDRTVIGAKAFIGSNSSLVAPVVIGEGAYVGSGSVITNDVAADALAVARGRQIEKSGWAASFRAARSAEKARRDAAKKKGKTADAG